MLKQCVENVMYKILMACCLAARALLKKKQVEASLQRPVLKRCVLFVCKKLHISLGVDVNGVKCPVAGFFNTEMS